MDRVPQDNQLPLGAPPAAPVQDACDWSWSTHAPDSMHQDCLGGCMQLPNPHMQSQMPSQMHPQMSHTPTTFPPQGCPEPMVGGYSEMHSQMQPHIVPQMLPQMHNSLQDMGYNALQHTYEQASAFGSPLQMGDSASMGMVPSPDMMGSVPTGQEMGMGLASGSWSGLLDELVAEQDAEGAPGVSGLDSEQERRRRERRRAMNRVAASRCRRRKLDRISQLESRVRSLVIDHQGLRATRAALRAQIEELKENVRVHLEHGCDLSRNI